MTTLPNLASSTPARFPPSSVESPRLTCEIVPRTCFWSNVRTLLDEAAWRALSDQVRSRANWRCEVCGALPPATDLHCHEVWRYDSKDHRRGAQVLERLISLCADCHAVKHLGFAELQGRQEQALAHQRRVNGWTVTEQKRYLRRMMPTWAWRDEVRWTCDVSALRQYGVEPPAMGPDGRPPVHSPRPSRPQQPRRHAR